MSSNRVAVQIIPFDGANSGIAATLIREARKGQLQSVQKAKKLFTPLCTHKWHKCSTHQAWEFRLQAAVSRVLSSTSAIFGYTISLSKTVSLLSYWQFFCWCSSGSKFATDNSDSIRPVSAIVLTVIMLAQIILNEWDHGRTIWDSEWVCQMFILWVRQCLFLFTMSNGISSRVSSRVWEPTYF